jgi:hypothetical protein
MVNVSLAHMVMTALLLGAACTFRVPRRDVFAALEANDKEVHEGVGAERRPPAVAVGAAAQEQEGTEAMDIAIAVVACKGAPERCENEGFSDKRTRSCS